MLFYNSNKHQAGISTLDEAGNVILSVTPKAIISNYSFSMKQIKEQLFSPLARSDIPEMQTKLSSQCKIV